MWYKNDYVYQHSEIDVHDHWHIKAQNEGNDLPF